MGRRRKGQEEMDYCPTKKEIRLAAAAIREEYMELVRSRGVRLLRWTPDRVSQKSPTPVLVGNRSQIAADIQYHGKGHHGYWLD